MTPPAGTRLRALTMSTVTKLTKLVTTVIVPAVARFVPTKEKVRAAAAARTSRTTPVLAMTSSKVMVA